MANIILLKQNATAGVVPAAGSMSAGELAINTGDSKLFTKRADNAIVQIGGEYISSVLAADNANVSANAFNDIAGLQMSLGANETWLFEYNLYVIIASTTATIGVNVEARSATGAVGNYTAFGMNGVPTAGAAIAKMAHNLLGTAVAAGQFGNTGATTAVTSLRVMGNVRMSSTPGTLIASLDASVNATAMTVKAGSSLTAWRVK